MIKRNKLKFNPKPQYNEDSMIATETWEFMTGSYTPVYGDNDRLPSGNLLGSFWFSDYDIIEEEERDAYEQFDARAMEIVRSTKLRAWSVSAQGALCNKGTCDNSVRGEWRMYSVERFYTAPLVHSVACSGGQLTFKSHNNFKQARVRPPPSSSSSSDDDDAPRAPRPCFAVRRARVFRGRSVPVFRRTTRVPRTTIAWRPEFELTRLVSRVLSWAIVI